MKKIFALALIPLLILACSKEENTPEGAMPQTNGQKTVFYATVEGYTSDSPGTKVYADENLKLLWNEDDRISVFNKTTFNYQYLFTGEDGDNAGSFEEIPETSLITANDIDHIIAVYPFSATNRVNNDGNQITVTLPAKQAYKEHSFGIGANTMVAATDNNFLSFKNVCGYLKFRLYGENTPISSITLQGNSGEKISGQAYITPTINGTPAVVVNEANSADTIMLSCTEPISLSDSETDYKEFYFAIPPMTFESGFTITVRDGNGGIFVKSSSKSLTIERNKMESMAPIKVVMSNGGDVITFSDTQIKAYCVSNFDTNNDREISWTEANAITKLHLTSNNFANRSSFEDVKYFRNLKHLVLGWGSSDPKLPLDLSKNPHLEVLQCTYALASLNITKNKKLQYLDCGGSNLTSLDLSNNTELTVLKCYGNYLSSLDLTNNTKLMELYCYNANKSVGSAGTMTIDLDLSHCPELHFLCPYLSGGGGTLFNSITVKKNNSILLYFFNTVQNLYFLKTEDDLTYCAKNVYYVD